MLTQNEKKPHPSINWIVTHPQTPQDWQFYYFQDFIINNPNLEQVIYYIRDSYDALVAERDGAEHRDHLIYRDFEKLIEGIRQHTENSRPGQISGTE